MLLDGLKRLDAYPKISLDDRDFRNKTILGAAITVVATLVMLALIVVEVNRYMVVHITEDLFVDTTRTHKLKINLDFHIPMISCAYLSLDAMDSGGDQHLHIDHDIFKRRVDLDGKPIDEAVKEEIKAPEQKTQSPDPARKYPSLLEGLPDSDMDNPQPNAAALKAVHDKREAKPFAKKCGDCYGAAANGTHCCNTCEQVIEAYRAKRWNPDASNFKQCIDEGYADPVSEQLAFKEGCKIYGFMEVNRMGGSFHIAPGRSFSMNHVHIHDVHPYSSAAFNTTHRIEHLSFGERLDAALTHPLDASMNVAKQGATMFQYYVKIVPTMFVHLNGTTIHTNQFSVTRHVKVMSMTGTDSGMPGIFFSYEMSPLMVKYTEREQSFGHLMVTICSIIGGIFTVAGIVDAMFYKTLHAIQKKIELGKFS